MVQEPYTAEVAGIPCAAIATEIVDRSVSPQELTQITHQSVRSLQTAETLGQIESEFQPLDNEQKIYQKCRDIKLPVTYKGIENNPRHLSQTFSFSKREHRNPLEPILEKVFCSFLSKNKTTCFLVDREHKIFHIFSDSLEDVLKVKASKKLC